MRLYHNKIRRKRKHIIVKTRSISDNCRRSVWYSYSMCVRIVQYSGFLVMSDGLETFWNLGKMLFVFLYSNWNQNYVKLQRGYPTPPPLSPTTIYLPWNSSYQDYLPLCSSSGRNCSNCMKFHQYRFMHSFKADFALVRNLDRRSDKAISI